MSENVVQKGILDQVKVRVRTHCPSRVYEREYDNIDEALEFLMRLKYEVR